MVFEIMDAPQFQVHKFVNLGNTFQITGPGFFEFSVYDDSFNYIYPVQVDTTNESQTVLLNFGVPIGAVVVRHLENSMTCADDYYEPFISGIVACDP